MTQGHFEAKKHAIRQTQDGWVVSFVVHPNDISATFATAPLGTRYMVGFAAIGDDEQPVPEPPSPPRGDTLRSERAKENYRQSSPAEQAICRAAILPKDERFRAWVAQRYNNGIKGDMVSQDFSADYIRSKCCGGKSRSLIAEVPEYLDRFLAMETEYLVDIGQIAEPR